MRVILVGYEGSKCILPTSKYLTSKYLPKDEFDVMYINHKGSVKEWTRHLSAFLSFFDDEYIIFALDDYLIADHIDMDIYRRALSEMGEDVVCIKLCKNTPEELAEYPVTTQYTIWNREYLISLFDIPPVETPWEFEMECSRHYFHKTCLLRTCLDYFVNSSISSRWKGVRLEGLKQEDIDYINKHQLITT